MARIIAFCISMGMALSRRMTGVSETTEATADHAGEQLPWMRRATIQPSGIEPQHPVQPQPRTLQL